MAINGRNRLKRSEMLDWDERYVETLGLRTDLQIILRTIPTVVLRRGSSNDVPRDFIEDVPPTSAPRPAAAPGASSPGLHRARRPLAPGLRVR